MTVDDDVMRLLRKEMRQSGVSFKAAVNHFLRLGLTNSKPRARKPFRVTPHKLELPAGLSYDNVEQLLESIEGAAHGDHHRHRREYPPCTPMTAHRRIMGKPGNGWNKRFPPKRQWAFRGKR
ncbi:MAG: hypothetical protein DMG60_17945 [Acidobacteria bacterium]|nr:MAG: hypothetical protein DMG60_17945 [Acidobacteriota bacterium]